MGLKTVIFGGVKRFLGLTDTPSGYSGEGGKYAKVKAAEDGLEFGTPAGSGDMTKAVYDPGDNGVVDNSEKLEGSTKAQVRDHAPQAHKATHQDGGADEMSIAGLVGETATAQPPKAHKTSHQSGGGDILYAPRTYIWFIPGTLATGTEQGPTFRLKRAATVEDVELHVKTAPTGAALIIDINEAGTTLFSTRPEIDADGTTEDDNHAFSDTALAAAELTMDIDQVGSGIAGAELTVILHCKEAVI